MDKQHSTRNEPTGERSDAVLYGPSLNTSTDSLRLRKVNIIGSVGFAAFIIVDVLVLRALGLGI